MTPEIERHSSFSSNRSQPPQVGQHTQSSQSISHALDGGVIPQESARPCSAKVPPLPIVSQEGHCGKRHPPPAQPALVAAKMKAQPTNGCGSYHGFVPDH